jgi:hypothetical protein
VEEAMIEVKCKKPKDGVPRFKDGTPDVGLNGLARLLQRNAEQPTPAIEVSGGLQGETWLDIEIDETLHSNQVRCSAAVYAALQLYVAGKAKGETR